MNLRFITDTGAPLRHNEMLLRLLWDHIKRLSEDCFDDGDLETIEKEEPLMTIGANIYWYKEKIDSKDDELGHAIAAFNALRGCFDLIYQDDAHYKRSQEQEELQKQLELQENIANTVNEDE